MRRGVPGSLCARQAAVQCAKKKTLQKGEHAQRAWSSGFCQAAGFAHALLRALNLCFCSTGRKLQAELERDCAKRCQVMQVTPDDMLVLFFQRMQPWRCVVEHENINERRSSGSKKPVRAHMQSKKSNSNDVGAARPPPKRGERVSASLISFWRSMAKQEANLTRVENNGSAISRVRMLFKREDSWRTCFRRVFGLEDESVKSVKNEGRNRSRDTLGLLHKFVLCSLHFPLLLSRSLYVSLCGTPPQKNVKPNTRAVPRIAIILNPPAGPLRRSSQNVQAQFFCGKKNTHPSYFCFVC